MIIVVVCFSPVPRLFLINSVILIVHHKQRLFKVLNKPTIIRVQFYKQIGRLFISISHLTCFYFLSYMRFS